VRCLTRSRYTFRRQGSKATQFPKHSHLANLSTRFVIRTSPNAAKRILTIPNRINCDGFSRVLTVFPFFCVNLGSLMAV
jgi:hypothetical protein